jgi:DNA-binding transcriptional regulator YiaG
MVKTKKTYKRKEWTKEEEDFLLNYAPVYNASILSKKLKRSKNAINAKLRYMNIKVINLQNNMGVRPVDFAEYMGINKNNVWNWIHRWKLPLIKYPKYMKFDKKFINYMLIDDTKIDQWLMTGYVYSDQIKPTHWYYKRMVNNVRREMDFEYILSQQIIKTCNITPKILQYWKYLRHFPRPVIVIPTKIVLYKRQDVIEWALNNPHYVTALQTAALRIAGIGDNLD